MAGDEVVGAPASAVAQRLGAELGELLSRRAAVCEVRDREGRERVRADEPRSRERIQVAIVNAAQLGRGRCRQRRRQSEHARSDSPGRHRVVNLFTHTGERAERGAVLVVQSHCAGVEKEPSEKNRRGMYIYII